jgi:methylmalonyl-CoA mutase
MEIVSLPMKSNLKLTITTKSNKNISLLSVNSALYQNAGATIVQQIARLDIQMNI